MSTTYTVQTLWRYPVKSMAGEELASADVTPRGLSGDRAYALVDPTANKVGSAKSVKRFGPLLKCRAEFAAPLQSGEHVPPVRMTLHNGTVLRSDQPNALAVLTAAFGPPLAFVRTAPEGLLLEFDAGTLAGKHAQTTEAPLAGGAPAGTLFDFASVHLLTTATLRGLRSAYPEGDFAVDRFRPNLVVDCGEESGYLENSWLGHTLAIGPEVQLRVSVPCARCVMPTLPRATLPHDPGILRTAAQQNRLDLGDFGHLPCVGVYADVVQPGRIGRGDAVRLLD